MSDHYDKNWQVKYDDSEGKIILYIKHPPKFGGICPLAEIDCGGPDDVGYENDMRRANWMAAAPAMLDELKQVVFLEKTNMTKKQVQLQIDRIKILLKLLTFSFQQV